MRFISKSLEWVLFTVVFFCVVMPIGYVVRKLVDPHRLTLGTTATSYFNRVPARTSAEPVNEKSISRNASA